MSWFANGKITIGNSNPLDLINGLDDLIDIDTYSGVDLTARLKTPVSSTAKEIIVRDHVNFPATNGLLKIDDEVIFYKTREHIEDGAGIYKLTLFFKLDLINLQE